MSSNFTPFIVLLTKISTTIDDKQVLIPSNNTHNSFFLDFNYYDFIIISLMKTIIYSSLIHVYILIISINFSPLFKNCDNFIIKEVLPHPVSPIIITGIFAFIL